MFPDVMLLNNPVIWMEQGLLWGNVGKLGKWPAQGYVVGTHRL